jgi:hypothetical protein
VSSGGHNLVRGSAEVDIEIDIFFFSVTVTIHAEYTFSGSDAETQRVFGQAFPTLAQSGAADPVANALSRQLLDLDSVGDWRTFRSYFAPLVPLEV